MRRLYDGGNGQVLSVVTRWLSSDSEQLQNSAALAIGNMARSGHSNRSLVCLSPAISEFALSYCAVVLVVQLLTRSRCTIGRKWHKWICTVDRQCRTVGCQRCAGDMQ